MKKEKKILPSQKKFLENKNDVVKNESVSVLSASSRLTCVHSVQQLGEEADTSPFSPLRPPHGWLQKRLFRMICGKGYFRPPSRWHDEEQSQPQHPPQPLRLRRRLNQKATTTKATTAARMRMEARFIQSC